MTVANHRQVCAYSDHSDIWGYKGCKTYLCVTAFRILSGLELSLKIQLRLHVLYALCIRIIDIRVGMGLLSLRYKRSSMVLT